MGALAEFASILHPLTVHLHVALLTMGFVMMLTWLFKGLGTAVFENRLHALAHRFTLWGVVFLVLSMAAGIHDGLRGRIVAFRDPLGRWLYVKVALAVVCFLVYVQFVRLSNRRREYLQEQPRLMAWCLAAQVVGYLLVLVISYLGTALVYHPKLLP